MALVFPLALDVFAEVVGDWGAGQRFYLNEPVSHQGLANGEINTASNAAAMWEGSFTTTITQGSAGKRLEALMDAIRGPNRTFLVRDLTYVGPQLDPRGAILAHRDLALAAVETARIKIGPASGAGQTQGFPPELMLLPGDMIGWQYGSNPLRYALHRVVPAQDSYGYAGSGVSEWIDVQPIVRGSPQPGDPVTLVKPVCKAIARPGTIQGGNASPGKARGYDYFSGWSFDWRQTLR